MNIGQIIEYCTQTVGDIDSDTQDFARKAVQLRYQLLYGAHNWQEAVQPFSLSITDTDTFYLPIDAELILWATPTVNGTRLPPLQYRERDWIEHHMAYTPYLSPTGPLPVFMYRAPNSALPTQSAGVLGFSVKDTTQVQLYVQGVDSTGSPLSETFLVNTNNPASPATPSSSNSYTLVKTLSKSASTYPVSVTTQDGVSVVMTPAMTELVYTVGKLWPPTTGTIDLLVGAKLRADVLDSDYSVPRISRLWNPLISFTNSALYKRQRQLTKASSEFQDATAMIQAAVKEEHDQASFRQQAVPNVYDGNFLPDYSWASSAYPWNF